jgi:hypothetical protein
MTSASRLRRLPRYLVPELTSVGLGAPVDGNQSSYRHSQMRGALTFP